MKAITLIQPWASMIALGAKRIETRGWATSYRGPLAVHAGQKTPPKDLSPECRAAVDEVLRYHGESDASMLPRGRVVATCELVDVVAVGAYTAGPVIQRVHPLDEKKQKLERALGNYEPEPGKARFAWILENVVRLDPPIAARGYQQLWTWERDA